MAAGVNGPGISQNRMAAPSSSTQGHPVRTQTAGAVNFTQTLGADLPDGIAPLGVSKFSVSADLKCVDDPRCETSDRRRTLGTWEIQFRPISRWNSLRINRRVSQIVFRNLAKRWGHPHQQFTGTVAVLDLSNAGRLQHLVWATSVRQ